MQNDASSKSQFKGSMVTIIVADMERSIDFYTKRLGLPLKARYGNEFAIVEAPGVAIAGDIVADPPMRFAFFKDPDGAELYLAERSDWQ